MNIFSRINSYLSLYHFRKKWRKLNMHNQTNVKRIFPLDIIVLENILMEL